MLLRPLPLGRGQVRPAGTPTAIMAILNATPDSFSGGGAWDSLDSMVDAARQAVAAGALLLDVGGESTRPGAEPVSEAEELARVIPLIRALVERGLGPISIDTTKAAVFAAAYECGASMLNDVSGLAADRELAGALARTEAAVVLMHRRGDPKSMDQLANYADPVSEVCAELGAATARAEQAGVPRERWIVDPGLGFAKASEHNWALLAGLDALHALGFPLLIGASRKRFLGECVGRSVARERDAATAALSGWLAARGVACVRVHDVMGSRDAMLVHERLALGARL